MKIRKWNNKIYLNFPFIWVLSLFGFGLGSSVYAQQFDQTYLKWKAEQEAHDAKLKKTDSNYYLSKPSVGKQKADVTSPQAFAGNTSKVRINTASVAELQQLNGVGEKKAQAIVEYRQKNGNFKTIDELKNVKGIGPKLIEKNQSRLGL